MTPIFELIAKAENFGSFFPPAISKRLKYLEGSAAFSTAHTDSCLETSEHCTKEGFASGPVQSGKQNEQSIHHSVIDEYIHTRTHLFKEPTGWESQGRLLSFL